MATIVLEMFEIWTSVLESTLNIRIVHVSMSINMEGGSKDDFYNSGIISIATILLVVIDKYLWGTFER